MLYVAAQRKMLTEQKRELLQMTLSMFNQDLTVDSSILLLAWVLTNTPMVDWPLRLVTVGTAALPVLPLRKARRQWVISRFARLFVLLMLSRTLRVGAIRRGEFVVVAAESSAINLEFGVLFFGSNSVF